MADGKYNRYWLIAAIFLVAVTVSGGILAWSRYRPGQPLEISIPPETGQPGRIYIGGAVANPGFYPMTTGDSLQALIRAAGGDAASANLGELKLYVGPAGAEPGPQKIDINRAEAWLLEVLPGIGEVLAQRIVDYRQQNGLFRNTADLTRVAGIATATYERIKHLITVSD